MIYQKSETFTIDIDCEAYDKNEELILNDYYNFALKYETEINELKKQLYSLFTDYFSSFKIEFSNSFAFNLIGLPI